MKRFSLILIVVVISLVSISAVGAQSPEGNRRGDRGNGSSSEFRATLESLGIDQDAIQAAAEAGTTWSDLITANGGNVADIQAQMIASILEKSDRTEAEVTERVEARLSSVVGEGRDGNGRRGDNAGQGMNAVADALGVTTDALREAAAAAGDDATPADVIESLGGDVDALAATIAAQISERTGEDVSEIQANLIERWNTPRSEAQQNRPNAPQGDNA